MAQALQVEHAATAEWEQSLPHLRACYAPPMAAVTGRVVKGKIVTRARLREGERVVILREDTRPPVELDPDEEAGVLKGLQEIRAGKGIPLDKFLRKLRRHRSR